MRLLILLVTGFLYAKGSELNVAQNVRSRALHWLSSIDCSIGEFHAHPYECGKFVHCAKGVGHVKSCPKSLHYSVEAHRCDHPCGARCDKNLVEECGWNKTTKIFLRKKIITLDKAGVCPVEELIPNKDDCTTFYVCCASGTFLMRCPSGLHFSPESERCLFPCEAKCDRNLDCELENRHIGFQCSSDNGLYGDPYDCSIYHDCSDFAHKMKRCKRGKYFDNDRRQCTGRRRARCLYQCPEPKGMFPHPKHCDMFVYCRNGKAVVKRCPAGKAFDVAELKCVRIERTNCRQNELLHILKPGDNASNS